MICKHCGKQIDCVIYYKTFIVTIIFSFIIGLLSCGKDDRGGNSTCIEFMEIPVTGSVDSFGEKLERKGYICNGEDALSRQIGYKGIYLNMPVLIVLYYEQDTRDINVVRAWFRKEMPNAASLINEYTEKFGECEMKADYGNVFYTWEVDGGYVGLVTDNSSFLAIDYSKDKMEY